MSALQVHAGEAAHVSAVSHRTSWGRRLGVMAVLLASFALTACGTLTGIPSHGGGKRFATEQRLVSASIRAALKDIDVTELRGKRAALVFDLVADEGGGNLSGGRLTPGLLFTAGSVVSPVTTTTNAFQVFNLSESGTNYNNTQGSGSGSSASTMVSSGSSSGSSTSVTGGTRTNSSFDQSDSSSNTTTGSSSNRDTNNSQGGFSTNRQVVSPSPSYTESETEGTRGEANVTLQYKGLGDYQNFSVPKSDASLLMGLVRNYLLFNGVVPTTPTDPSAEVLVYVTVDIFGTVRSRFDALIYNNETVKAETSFEISAFDRKGRMIMRPQVSNRESKYREHYVFWAGPLTTQEKVYKGEGLLVDFTDVDGTKANYNGDEEQSVKVNHFLGKN
ncbi:hypothetical protein [Hydrogenophaga sp. 5NK40-0174]|uniref:hypothetical protein n=1 Tax=Hydrogenophaga sp. 5NK40-0174 TaxID=3127649 RepID=UPI0031067E0B